MTEINANSARDCNDNEKPASKWDAPQIITIVISILAFIGSIVSIYYSYFYVNDSVLCSIVKVERQSFSRSETHNNQQSFLIDFIIQNNGTESIAIQEYHVKYDYDIPGSSARGIINRTSSSKPFILKGKEQEFFQLFFTDLDYGSHNDLVPTEAVNLRFYISYIKFNGVQKVKSLELPIKFPFEDSEMLLQPQSVESETKKEIPEFNNVLRLD